MFDSKKLARCSKEAGHTKLLNVFELKKHLEIIDTPGYGHKSEFEHYDLINSYIRNNHSTLKRIFLLVDYNRGFKLKQSSDNGVVNLIEDMGVQFQIVITKIDKILRITNKNFNYREHFIQQNKELLRYLSGYYKGFVPNLIFTSKLEYSEPGNSKPVYLGINELKREIIKFCRQ